MPLAKIDAHIFFPQKRTPSNLLSPDIYIYKVVVLTVKMFGCAQLLNYWSDCEYSNSSGISAFVTFFGFFFFFFMGGGGYRREGWLWGSNPYDAKNNQIITD
jgi:hypothetical protein